jgi:hypothetical protein
MRAWDIAVLLICFNLAIGLVGSIGLFTHMYYEPVQQNVLEVNGYMQGNSNASQKLIDSAKTTNADYFSLGTMLFGAFNIFINVLGSAVFILPTLVTTFGIPLALASVLQVLIWLINVWGIIQFMSGRSGSLMQ